MENGGGGDGRQALLPSRCLLVFADRKTKRNGRQQEQEIDHEEIVEEEAGKREEIGELEKEKKREKEE